MLQSVLRRILGVGLALFSLTAGILLGAGAANGQEGAWILSERIDRAYRVGDADVV
jgi:hypothetical protein